MKWSYFFSGQSTACYLWKRQLQKIFQYPKIRAQFLKGLVQSRIQDSCWYSVMKFRKPSNWIDSGGYENKLHGKGNNWPIIWLYFASRPTTSWYQPEVKEHQNMRIWQSPIQRIDSDACMLFHIPLNRELHPHHKLYTNVCFVQETPERNCTHQAKEWCFDKLS